MRVVVVLLALVAMPCMASFAQGLPGKSNCVNGKSAANRSAQGTLQAHGGLCATQDPPLPQQPPPPPPDQPPPPPPDQPPPPPPGPAPTCTVTPPSTAGTSSIDGQVFVDQSPWTGLANWCVQLLGPVNASTLTDASGNYNFTGLPGGDYTVCEVVSSGWQQTFPNSAAGCPNGMGWSFTLTYPASFVNFGNLPTP